MTAGKFRIVRDAPRLEIGDGFWPRMSDALMATSEPIGSVFGLACRTNKLMPPNMAVLIDASGEITILDARTDEEKAAFAAKFEQE